MTNACQSNDVNSIPVTEGYADDTHVEGLRYSGSSGIVFKKLDKISYWVV